MNLQIKDELIPGTKLLRSEMGGVTGLEFLNKVFFISEGVMLTQIRDISGIDGSTLQNWTKRGWVANSRLKKYNINQIAHILIINMLRSCMQLDRIAFLIQYINGKIDDSGDDIIEDSILYDYDSRLKTHDFRMVRGNGHTNLIFDIVLPDDIRRQENDITHYLNERLSGTGMTYYTVITFDSAAFDPNRAN